jgi:hypothetical protein
VKGKDVEMYCKDVLMVDWIERCEVERIAMGAQGNFSVHRKLEPLFFLIDPFIPFSVQSLAHERSEIIQII